MVRPQPRHDDPVGQVIRDRCQQTHKLVLGAVQIWGGDEQRTDQFAAIHHGQRRDFVEVGIACMLLEVAHFFSHRGAGKERLANAGLTRTHGQRDSRARSAGIVE
jgi:hypothetical protein